MSNYDASIKAIETRYKGYRFRSRFEARWAVFFDAMGVAWEYEDEGYSIDGTPYLPDFVLGASRSLIVEIKPPNYLEAIGEASAVAEVTKWIKLAGNGKDMLVAFGAPPCEDHEQDQKRFIVIPQCWGVDDSAGADCGFLGECRGCGSLGFSTGARDYYSLLCAPGCECEYAPRYGKRIAAAARKARGARFEHGESGAG